MNKAESEALGIGSPEDVVRHFESARKGQSVIVTLGAEGAIYCLNGTTGKADAVRCVPVDANGSRGDCLFRRRI